MINTYLKINDLTYPATFYGRVIDSEWDGRQSKTINLTMSYETAKNLFKNDIHWSVIEEITYSNQEETIVNEYDNSEFNILGPITVFPDGKLSVKMGKMTDLEEAYELLYGGVI